MSSPTKYPNQKIAKRPSAAEKAVKARASADRSLELADHLLAIGDREGVAQSYHDAADCLEIAGLLCRLAAVQVMPIVTSDADGSGGAR